MNKECMKLTEAQLEVLEHAVQLDGLVFWAPSSRRSQIVVSLARLGLLAGSKGKNGFVVYKITDAGRAALAEV